MARRVQLTWLPVVRTFLLAPALALAQPAVWEQTRCSFAHLCACAHALVFAQSDLLSRELLLTLKNATLRTCPVCTLPGHAPHPVLPAPGPLSALVLPL